MTYVFHTRCGCIPCGLSILLSPPRRAGWKGVGCSHRQCYRLFNACSTGPTHQTCLTAYRRVGDLRSIRRVPNLTDNGVLMVHRAWSDRFRCTKANQPNFRLRRKQIRWDWKKDSSFYKPRLKSISVVGNWLPFSTFQPISHDTYRISHYNERLFLQIFEMQTKDHWSYF